MSKTSEKTTVSIVLGGGGAKGLAHIGAIEAIEEAGYDIGSVSGTSIGAIVGGLYAAGKLHLYKEWVLSLSRLDVVKLLDPSLSVNGILKGEKIFNKIEEMCGEIAVEELPVKFSAVTTDITNEKEFWFQEGPLLTAMRASMAIPNIFTPVKHNKRFFVDGGVTNPVPVTPTLADNTDLIFAVSLNGEPENDPLGEEEPEEEAPKSSLASMINEYFADKEDEPLGHLDIFLKSLDIMQHSISRHKLASTPPDLLIEMPENLCSLFDYHKAEALIAYGKERTAQALARLPKNR